MNRNLLITCLLIGALGIAMLWAAGVEFPVAVPPGMVILAVGAAVVAAVRRVWTDALGAALGLFVTVGFVSSGLAGDGFASISGDHGALGVIGQLVQLVGVVGAVVVGVALVLRAARRRS